MAKKPGTKLGSDDRQSDVGYGNPPRHTRFKPGTSGNPRGRPLRNQEGLLSDLIGRELYQVVQIQQDGRPLKLPRFQVALRRLMMAAMKGDALALKAVVQLGQMHEQGLAAQKSKQPMMTNEERERKVLQIFESARLRKLATEQKEKASLSPTKRIK